MARKFTNRTPSAARDEFNRTGTYMPTDVLVPAERYIVTHAPMKTPWEDPQVLAIFGSRDEAEEDAKMINLKLLEQHPLGVTRVIRADIVDPNRPYRVITWCRPRDMITTDGARVRHTLVSWVIAGRLYRE